MNIWEQNAQRWGANAQRWIQNEQRRTAPPPRQPNQIRDRPKQQPPQSRELIRPPAPKPNTPPPAPVYRPIIGGPNSATISNEAINQGWGKPIAPRPVVANPILAGPNSTLVSNAARNQGWGKPQLRDLPVFQSPVSLKDALILGALFLAWRIL